MSHNRRSRLITQGVARSPNRAMLDASATPWTAFWSQATRLFNDPTWRPGLPRLAFDSRFASVDPNHPSIFGSSGTGVSQDLLEEHFRKFKVTDRAGYLVVCDVCFAHAVS